MQSATSFLELHIRDASPADASAIAALHSLLLPHGFFARLGQRFLRVYHRSFMASPYAVSLVACRGDQVVGMIAGAFDAREHQRHTLRRLGPRLLCSAFPALVLRPRLALEFVTTRTGRYLRTLLRAVGPVPPASPASAGAAPKTLGPIAVLTHVAVDAPAQGCGAGSALVDAFVDRVRVSGATRIELVTLAEEGASSFYERLGWTLEGEHEREGVTYRRFTLALP